MQRITVVFHHQVLPPPSSAHTHLREMQVHGQNKELFGGGNRLPELLEQSCHIASELSSGLGPCLESLARSWHHSKSLLPATTFEATLRSDIALQLLYLGKAWQKLVSASRETGWIRTIPTAGCWGGKNPLTASVSWHVAPNTLQEFSFKEKAQQRQDLRTSLRFPPLPPLICTSSRYEPLLF